MFKNKNTISVIIFVVAIIIIGAIIYSGQGSKNLSLSGTVSKEEAEDIAMDFINNVMLQGQTPASFTDISEEFGLYKIGIMYQGNPFYSYMTKDGKTFFPEAMNIEEIKSTVGNQPAEVENIQNPATTSYNNIDDFVTCLKDKGFVFYGANWCGYCKALIDVFGGRDIVDPLYVECTEEEALCREKNIEGYPTILINGERYSGARTLEAFSSKTGCELL